MKRNNTPFLLLGVAIPLLVGTGAAAWVFNDTTAVSLNATVEIPEWIFAKQFGLVDNLLDCLNNPNSTEGKAYTNAVALSSTAQRASGSTYKGWISNLDTKKSWNGKQSVQAYLETAFPDWDNETYIIKYPDASRTSTIDLYITTDALSYPPAKTITVYKSTYTKKNGVWTVSDAVEGTCTTTYYDSSTSQYQASFDTGTFKAK